MKSFSSIKAAARRRTSAHNELLLSVSSARNGPRRAFCGPYRNRKIRPIPKRSHPLVVPGTISAVRAVPEHIPRPDYSKHVDYGNPEDINTSPHIRIWNDQEIDRMRNACRLARRVLEQVCAKAAVGVTTEELDVYAHELIVAAGAYPSPLGYGSPPYPKAICTSINEVLCHGIPDSRKLQEGEILNIDVTVFLDGFHGDCSQMVLIGNVDENARRLVRTTELCLRRGIEVCGPGVPFSAIGSAIEKLANNEGYSVAEAFVGHGVGHDFHTPPFILHFENGLQGAMRPGMIFTIGPDSHKVWGDNWTEVSAHGGWGAQAEHTILVTPTGAEILTKREEL